MQRFQTKRKTSNIFSKILPHASVLPLLLMDYTPGKLATLSDFAFSIYTCAKLLAKTSLYCH